MEIEGRGKVDELMAKALMGPGGVLSKDRCLALPGSTDREAEKNFLATYQASLGHVPAEGEDGDVGGGGSDGEDDDDKGQQIGLRHGAFVFYLQNHRDSPLDV